MQVFRRLKHIQFWRISLGRSCSWHRHFCTVALDDSDYETSSDAEEEIYLYEYHGSKPSGKNNLKDNKDEIEWLNYRIDRFEEVWQRQEEERSNATGELIVTLPDGKVCEGIINQTTPLDIAQNFISKGFAKKCIVAKVFPEDSNEGELWDMGRALEFNCKIKLMKFDDEEGNETFWHSSSHVLGQSLERLYKGKLTFGPALEPSEQLSQGGFFYDVAVDEYNVSGEDFAQINKMCQKIVKEDQPFQRVVLTKDEALDMFQENQYKQHFISSKIGDGETCTAYRCGPLVDLCTGPHIPTTKMIKSMQVVKNASSYWQGKAGNDVLQRVYGVSFPDKKLMKKWEQNRKKALENDHRRLGKDLDLFFFDDVSPGSCFWLPYGARIYNGLIEYQRKQYRKRGFSEVVSPNMYSVDLYNTSGHAAKYKEDMFMFDVEGKEFGLKPMNCPGHCVMFKHQRKSYRDLPIRMADFGALHRNEASGALTGLTRVRRFAQDDAHIFCRGDQVEEEIVNALGFMDDVYGVFGFKFELDLSTRPDSMIGDPAVWDVAEQNLAEALDIFCAAHPEIKPWKLNEGDGAFYGPKIDIKVYDSMGRKHQCATIQLDFNLPERFQLEYQNASNENERPVMIHRAIFGSLERFTAILLEHEAGHLPFWISPRQICVIPVAADNANHVEYAFEVARIFSDAGFYADVDDSNNRMKKKIALNRKKAYNIFFIVGDNEINNRSVNVRKNKENATNEMGLDDCMSWLEGVRENCSREF